jgi:hypothetical protein
MWTMSETRLLVQAPVRRPTTVETDVERVRRHVARIRMQIRELEQRTKRDEIEPAILRVR